jgi:hypothetical protein
MPWSRRFEDPIPLDRGRELVTLEDAANYILTLGDREAKAEHWKVAGEVLIMAAEGRGPIMHARIGMLRALQHGRPAPAVERRKRAKAFKIVR